MAKAKKGSSRNKKSKVKVEDLAPQQDPKGGAYFDSFLKVTTAPTVTTVVQDPALNFTVKL